MNKKVIITVRNKQIIDDRKEQFELVTPGKFYSKEGSYYAVYDETEISGMEGTTTALKIGGREVRLIRFGTTSSNMSFRNGVEDTSLYKTRYGVIELTIRPTSVEVNVDDSGGDIRLLYDMDVCGQKTSSNELMIKIQ